MLGQQLVVRLLTSSQKLLSLPKFSYLASNLNLVRRPLSLSLRGDVKEAYLCSITENHNNVSKVTNKAKDHNSFYSQLQIDDLYFQLAPDGYVAVCARDSLLSKL